MGALHRHRKASMQQAQAQPQRISSKVYVAIGFVAIVALVGCVVVSRGPADSVLLSADAVEPEAMSPELKKEVRQVGKKAKAPEEWEDTSTPPVVADDDADTDDSGGDVTHTDIPADAKWHPAASAIARNCEKLKVFGYASADYREDLGEGEDKAMGVLYELFQAIAPGMYDKANETPRACVTEYNNFIVSVKSQCEKDGFDSIPCKMVDAIQESMQKDGILEYVEDKSARRGAPKLTVDGTKIGLSDKGAYKGLKIGVTDSEFQETLRMMKDQYANEGKPMEHGETHKGETLPPLSVADQGEYHKWDGNL